MILRRILGYAGKVLRWERALNGVRDGRRQGRIPTWVVVLIGHWRWAIENQAFNELTTRWHADHVYKHHGNAILVFCLLAMLCLTVFLAFYRRNLKPAVRKAAGMLHIAREIAAELYYHIARSPPPVPT